MTAEERSLLEALDTIVRPEEVRAQIYSIVERVRTELARNKTAQMTWEPIPLTIYGGALPSGIRSSWVLSCAEARPPEQNAIRTVING
jgi:hypothetical protein